MSGLDEFPLFFGTSTPFPPVNMITLGTLTLALLTPSRRSRPSPRLRQGAPVPGTKSMTVNGRQRQYILQLPNNYDRNKQHRVVIGYHWRDGSMNDVASGGFYGLRQLAAPSLSPQRLERRLANNGGEDITFTDQIVAMLKNDLCVNEGEFFATGWSYGGAMSHSAACSRPDVFKAVAVIAGAQLSAQRRQLPCRLPGMHGAADNVLPSQWAVSSATSGFQTNGCTSKNAPAFRRQQNHIKEMVSATATFSIARSNRRGGIPALAPRDMSGSQTQSSRQSSNPVKRPLHPP
ncbi:LOW QUALITY PROTEIN: uncharacterized protein QC761_0024620 [Podospora bellae-mahoneyi]|uniref:Feruloyl esterase C n=1 Tax=Podospora bellae-mahoneyi TaxID=2093777 RepID=A0ABR0FVK8_9PEZI|nr:LOW QUALITY PROTEIN: hypothetical protein QC761_0024620 [Podospora bellae-mahoneyi]